MPRILLYKDADAEMFLDGTDTGGQLDLTSLTVLGPVGPEVFTLPVGEVIPKDWLVNSGGDYLIVQGPADQIELKILVPLCPADEDFSFLGGKFGGTAGYSISLAIHVTPKGIALPDGWFALHVCGTLDAAGGGGGGAAHIEAAICCEVRIPRLPEGDDFHLPRLHIDLPDLGLELPGFEMPSVGFPRLPGFPWSFGAPSLQLPLFFLKLSWRSVGFSHENGFTIVDIVGLRLEGPTGRAVEMDVHLAIQGGSVTTHSYLDLYKGDGTKTRLGISHWYRSGSCTAIGWTGRQLEQWLGLLLPEMLTPDLPDDCDIVLRWLRDEGGVREVRLDYVPKGAQGWDLKLPGFEVGFPLPQFYSLVLWQEKPDEEEVDWRLAVLAVLAKDAAIKGHTTFALGDEGQDGRELHNNGGEESEHLLTLTGTPKVDGLALVVADMPIGGGKPRFFKRARNGVVGIDWNDQETLEMLSVTGEEALREDDIELDFKLNPEKLPFLRRDGGDNPLSQYIEVTPGKGNVDFPNTTFSMPLAVTLHLGAFAKALELDMSSSGEVGFNWERFSLNAGGFKKFAFCLKNKEAKGEFLGLNWTFENAPGDNGALFTLDLVDGNVAIRQAKGAKITASFTRITKEPLVFHVENFVLGPRGLSIDARMERCHANLNGVATMFQFDDASLQMRDNKITGFTIGGSGTLPPDLVGDAKASVALQFGQNDSGSLELLSAGASLVGRNLLRCQATRFDLAIDGIGLRFVNEHGDYHLYFTLTGMARFNPLAGDDAQGPLAWLPKVEIQFVDCPLAGDVSVLAKHIRFYVEMPRKVSFNFLGCFTFELRGFGFVPEVDFWDDKPAAMILCGQIKFAVDGGDVVDARFDFHNLYLALPDPDGDDFMPRLRCRNLGVKLRVGEAFELEGLVDFIEGEELEPGWRARGFRGQGGITIMGLPKFHTTFAFLRVLQQKPEPRWVRAWFLYAEVRHLSLRIPAPVPLFIREIGLGLGYRHTLSAIKRADELDDIKVLIKELDKLAVSQGELSSFNAWRLDVETPPEQPRWTVVMRGMLATASASSGATDWHADKEKDLPNILLMDAVMGLRSDFTFYLNVRAWLFTNYFDYDTDVNGVRTKPLLFGYALFQPRKKRLLAHAASGSDPAFGEHPPLWPFMKEAIKSSHYSATVLIEPGLFHTELGWPNMLRWGMDWGPFKVECRGGALFRVSRREMVQGMSFEARGGLSLSAEFSAGPVGARLWAEARLAFGARYIFVLGLDRLDRTAFYAAVGLELRVNVGIALWIRIKIGFCKITLSFSFSFELAFTALVEVGAQLTALPGCRGTADVCLNLMGRGLHFHIHVGVNESSVDRALEITKPFLNVGLEATEVEPLPGEKAAKIVGTGAADGGGGAEGLGFGEPAPIAEGVSGLALEAAAIEESFVLPDYDVITVPATNNGKKTWFLVLVPSARMLQGFVAVPPSDGAVDGRGFDYKWDLTSTPLEDKLAHVDYDKGTDATNNIQEWKVAWKKQEAGTTTPNEGGGEIPRYLYQLLRHAYIPATQGGPDLGDVIPKCDPDIVKPDREGDTLHDERVLHPSDQNYEAAVRGAVEQFQGSPYLKHDPGIDYEKKLRLACQEGTSIYQKNPGTKPNDQEREAEEWQRQATELRSTVINGLVEDVRAYAKLHSEDGNLEDFRKKSVAFGLGLVFQYVGDEPPVWLTPMSGPLPDDLGKIYQASKPESLTPDGGQRTVRPYNTHLSSFLHHPAEVQVTKVYESASTIAVAWNLKWDVDEKPEEHLGYYRVVRRKLSGGGVKSEGEVSFDVRPVDLLLKEKAGGDNNLPITKIIAIPGRFQFVDHFKEESEDEIAALPVEGILYSYTIIPVDLTGQESPRGISFRALRKPNRAPLAPQDTGMRLEYRLEDADMLFKPKEKPLPLMPSGVTVEMREPPVTDDSSFVPARQWRLVLRRERTLPVGSYPADSSSDSPRQAAPSSFARPLPSDVKITLPDSPDYETREDGRYLVWEVQVEALQKAGVLPRGQAGEWKPAAWRIMIQAGSDKNEAAAVWSSLVPVQLELAFSRMDDGTQRRVCYRPELLEWVLQPMKLDFLEPLEGQSDANFATVPRPVFGKNGVAGQFDLAGTTLKDQSLKFLQHPKKWRVARLRWNHIAATASPALRELAAGYRLFEFDADEHLSDRLIDPALTMEGFLNLTREVRQVRLLPENQITLTPADNLAPDQWDAWYPSTARRMHVRALSADRDQPGGRGQDQWLSPWFSWRDSYLEWPEMPAGWLDMRLAGNTPASLAGCVVDEVSETEVVISMPTNMPEGMKAEEFERRKAVLLGCGWFEFGGLKDVLDNVLHHGTRIGAENRFSFPRKQFQSLKERDNLVLSQPNGKVHWFLESLITRIEARFNTNLDPETARFYGVQADPCLIPPGKAKELKGFRAETSAAEDGYGWNLLKRLGLSGTVTFRNIRTGMAEEPGLVWKHLQGVLKEVSEKDPMMKEMLGHLHVELLFQPGRSVRMEGDPNQTPDEKEDLLAMLQLSLRPRIKQGMVYERYTREILPDEGDGPFEVTIQAPPAGPCAYIEEGENTVVVMDPGSSATIKCRATAGKEGIQGGVINILVRYRVDQMNPDLRVVKGFEPQKLSPTDWEAARFQDLRLCWYKDGDTPDPDQKKEPEHPNAYAAWERLFNYLRAAGLGVPDEEKKEEDGKKNQKDKEKNKEEEALEKLCTDLNTAESLDWLRRLFNCAEDFEFAEGSVEVPKPVDGPWIATAYPQSNTQLFAAPRKGRLEMTQLIDDSWAHAFRYFALPATRYDQLWLGLAQSETLYPEVDRRERNLENLLEIKNVLHLKHENGGLDVTLPRIRRLAPPLVLSSARLDNVTPTVPGQETALEAREPGTVWEVVLAKHLEQRLSERNRMLAQRLEFQQVAWSMKRRFAFRAEREALFEMAEPANPETDWQVIDIDTVQDHYEGELPPAPDGPDWIPVPKEKKEIGDTNRSLMLTDRMDPLEHQAFALQWRHLPFFYEHRLLLIAQAGVVVSPMVRVTQRDFGFVSPESSPVEDAQVIEVTVDGVKERRLMVDLRLARLWDSLPEGARAHWDIENPDKAHSGEIRPASLPDPEVVYEVINTTTQLMPVRDAIARLTVKTDPENPEWELVVPSPRFDALLEKVIKPAKATAGKDRWLARIAIKSKSKLPELKQAVGSRYPFNGALLIETGLKALPPEMAELTWHGKMSEVEAGQLGEWAEAADFSFASALRALIAQGQGDAEDAGTIKVTASAGLDQLEEIDDSFENRVTVTETKLEWRGGLAPEEKALLATWRPNTPFKSTIDVLVAAAEAEQSETFASAPTQPPPPFPPGISVVGDKLVKASGSLLPAAVLAQFENPDPAWEDVVQVAARRLAKKLSVIMIPISDPGWRRRPSAVDVIEAGLGEKLLIARSLLSTSQPLTHVDAQRVIKSLTDAPMPVWHVIRLLYEAGERAMLAGGTLTLRSRRSVAMATKEQPITLLNLQAP